jgi:hypothetical protein
MELAGQPEGREHEFWYQAERELKTGDSQESRGVINSEEKSDTFLENRTRFWNESIQSRLWTVPSAVQQICFVP